MPCSNVPLSESTIQSVPFAGNPDLKPHVEAHRLLSWNVYQTYCGAAGNAGSLAHGCCQNRMFCAVSIQCFGCFSSGSESFAVIMIGHVLANPRFDPFGLFPRILNVT